VFFLFIRGEIQLWQGADRKKWQKKEAKICCYVIRVLDLKRILNDLVYLNYCFNIFVKA
jgi:hypothetical protein